MALSALSPLLTAGDIRPTIVRALGGAVGFTLQAHDRNSEKTAIVEMSVGRVLLIDAIHLPSDGNC